MKKWTKNEKNKKQEKIQKHWRKKRGKKGKEGPKGLPPCHPRWAQKLIFHIRTVKRNRNEIEAQKKSDFEHPTKTKKMKEHKENERKWKKIKENQRKCQKMSENEGKWRTMKDNEGTWRNMKEHEGTWRKMKENEGKWRKMKENEGRRRWKNEKMKKWKKTRKMEKNDEKRKKNDQNWIQMQNPSTISMILFRNVSFSQGKSTTRFGGLTVFPKSKTHIFLRKSTKKSVAVRSGRCICTETWPSRWPMSLLVQFIDKVWTSLCLCSDVVSHWEVPQFLFIAGVGGHPSCGETWGLSARGSCDEVG